MDRHPSGDQLRTRRIGMTIGTLFDETGAVGAIQQSVLIRPMPGR